MIKDAIWAQPVIPFKRYENFSVLKPSSKAMGRSNLNQDIDFTLDSQRTTNTKNEFQNEFMKISGTNKTQNNFYDKEQDLLASIPSQN
jgi:hypothetical protein